MSTPVTLKQMEEAKKRAEQRKKRAEQQNRPLGSVINYGWTPNYTSYKHRRNVHDIDFTSDQAGGRQYLSFERNGKQRNPPGQLPALDPQEVVDIPHEMEVDEYKISPDNLLCFSGTTHFLSNFHIATLNIDGHDYQSVEHYYQACKLYTLAGAEFAAQLRHIHNPAKVKSLTRRILTQLRVGKDKIDEWKKTHGFVLLHHALVHKFVQNVDLRQKLIETSDKILAHTFERDNLFACGAGAEDIENWAKENDRKSMKIPVDINIETLKHIPLTGKGKNLLGVICMKVRKQLQNYKPSTEIETEPLLSSLLDEFKLTSVNDSKPGSANEQTE